MFITFEGGEGAGKTTLIEGIEKALIAAGRSVLKTREPGGTPLGEELRNVVLHTEHKLSPYAELAIYLASRAQHISQKIVPALERGEVVLCDRFNDSSIAYQGAARGLGMEKVAEFCNFISQGLQPNLTFYLDISPTIGLERARSTRVGLDRIESETILFHEKIREAYHLIHRQYPQRFHLLDATQTKEEVLRRAMLLIEPLLKRV